MRPLVRSALLWLLVLSPNLATLGHSMCTTALDCELLGDCIDGRCVCDRGWRGPTCTALNQAASTVVWPRNSQSYSWGASVLRLGDETHMYNDVGCLTDTCAHTVGAHIAHSVSREGVYGPFSMVETAVPGEVENIHAVQSPNGTVLLYYGDHQFSWPNKTCDGAGNLRSNPYPRRVKRMGIAHRHGQGGPWSYLYPTYDSSMDKFLPVVNPSPHVMPNGTVLLAFRYDCESGCSFGETNALAIADTWEGPYRLVTANATPGVNCEDPFMMVNQRGYHMIFHCYRDLNTGCHSYSADGVTWHVSSKPVYNTTLKFANGTMHTFQYRERPELLFDRDGVPEYLLSGIEWGDKTAGPGGCGSFSVVTTIEP